MKKAIITINDNGIYEARCRNCGKLLFTFNTKNSKNPVDESSQSVIIVARCTRNTCKTDNKIYL